MTAPTLTAMALVCSLKRRPAESSSELIAGQVLENLGALGVPSPMPPPPRRVTPRIWPDCSKWGHTHATSKREK